MVFRHSINWITEGDKKMIAIYKALKNSNVSEYVKGRVLNSNLDYLLNNGVLVLLNQLSEPIEIDYLVLWQNGILELSTSSEFYKMHSPSMFKNSISGQKDIKGINKNSLFYKRNKEVLQNIERKVLELSMPIRKELAKTFFGVIYDGLISQSNVEKYYYFNNNAYIAIKQNNRVPEATLEQLESIKLSEFYLLYEKELAKLAS